MNFWILSFIAIILGATLLEITSSILNLKAFSPTVPEQFSNVYDHEKYKISQEYSRTTATLGITENIISSLLTVVFLILGGFDFIDGLVRSSGYSEITCGLLYIGSFAAIAYLFSLPFSLYATFVIEERFGFNHTTVKIFILDMIKGIILSLVIGTPLLAAILWFFEKTGTVGWLYCWLVVNIFTLFIQFAAPAVILPLFNKFSPLANGSLRQKIEQYAAGQNFALGGIYTMDGSKRSSKLNAFFTGFGRFRRIVLFDTLVEKLKEEQIVAVLAHEMGHFKLRHILKMFTVSLLQIGIFFFLLGQFLSRPEISSFLGVTIPSIHSGLVFFGILFSPLSILMALFINRLSRTHEYQADSFASATTSDSQALIDALIILSKENPSNLTPHPLKVILHYSHPSILERIKALQHFASPAKEST